MPLSAKERKRFQDNVDELLTLKGWSHRQAARQTGVSVGTIENILHGRIATPHATTLNKLAIGFEVTPERLLGHLYAQATRRQSDLLRAVAPFSPRSQQQLAALLRSLKADLLKPTGRRPRRRRPASAESK